ncbi:hypothetical protein RRG08_039453 [Elysia crispata]|uniref:Transcription initiation factor IIF subunit alpha n=1 Tax=Elysia crispata TaxID=231223 RepID=A0AAE1D0N9_9GAST|nr:hypothetical protein RRG08_039453 [Elysia crispata]
MASYHVSTLSKPPAPSVQPTGSAAASSMEDVFTVRIPRDRRCKFSMMKFGTASNVDFAKVGDQPVKMERENNLREYKTANDLDTMPKFGAGSEFGRDQKEESRRKKYGIMLKRYNPDDQPWHLKIGSGKQAKRYKGVREGTISENTSYYIFTKAADGAFEAFPVEEWYNFSPIVKYKYLNSDEAEEEFSRRDKTLNYFSIMVKKRLKREEDVADEDDEGTKGQKTTKKAKKDLILTDMDEWNDLKMSDDEDEDDLDEDNNDDDTGASKKKKKPKVTGKKKGVKNSKKNSDDEAVEESDEGDHDDREVDYMSDSGSDSSLSGPEADGKEKKYDEKGVDQEAGLRNILDSDAEEEEAEGEEEEADKEEPEEETEEKKEKKKGEDNSSSSSSDDDSDIEKDAKLASDIILQQPQTDLRPGETGVASAAETSTISQEKIRDKSLKRKGEKLGDGKMSSAKKHKSEVSDGISEDAIRRYLLRKPMTTKDLLTKFKAKKLNMSNERITHDIAQILKRINPDKRVINKVLYLSLKKPE